MATVYDGKPNYFVDRTSPIPAYQQIANSVINRISDKEWLIGEKLPSEFELAAAYGVSRVTLRQAMSQLESDGIIEKYRGKGIFVKSNPRHVVQNLEFPTVDIQTHQPVLDSTIRGIYQCMAPNHDVAHHLNAREDELLTYLQRVFLHEGKPIGLNNVWFRAETVPDIGNEPFVDGSLSKTMLYRYHQNVVTIENDIECIRLDAVSAEILASAYDSLALKINSQHLLEDGTPVQYSSTLWLADYTQFHYTAKK